MADLNETTSEIATPLLQVWGAKLNVWAAWFLGLFGTVTLDKLVALSGLVLGVAGYLMNRHYRRKEDRRQALRAKRDDEQARRQHSTWVMDMRAKYSEEKLVAQLGENWSDYIKLPASGDTDLGALS
ncbi:hypothetical protein [Comamonas odontotermitis]|uniref:hypothetical protein n=1 Tax=Comamonas odontotermitis TaxID=379895 RepID=UPI003752255F